MEWISVKDRLPETNDEYIVVWNLFDGQPASVTMMEYTDGKFLDVAGFVNADCTNEITHWMPLPEPPKQ